MTAGPVEPRDSKFSATPPSAASGCWLTNASAPHRQASSPSVNRKTRSLAGARPGHHALRRLQQGGDACPVVVAAERHLHGVVVREQHHPSGRAPCPGKTATTLRPRPCRTARSSAPLPPTASWISRLAGRCRSASSRCSRARCGGRPNPPDEPADPICSTCANARSALNSSAGASAPTGAGGDDGGDAERGQPGERQQQQHAGDDSGPRSSMCAAPGHPARSGASGTFRSATGPVARCSTADASRVVAADSRHRSAAGRLRAAAGCTDAADRTRRTEPAPPRHRPR